MEKKINLNKDRKEKTTIKNCKLDKEVKHRVLWRKRISSIQAYGYISTYGVAERDFAVPENEHQNLFYIVGFSKGFLN